MTAVNIIIHDRNFFIENITANHLAIAIAIVEARPSGCWLSWLMFFPVHYIPIVERYIVLIYNNKKYHSNEVDYYDDYDKEIRFAQKTCPCAT